MLELGAPPMRGQTQVPLMAPVREVRRVETLTPEEGTDHSGFLLGRNDLGQNVFFVVGGELPTLFPDYHFRIGRRFDHACRYAAFGFAPLGLTPLRARRNQNAGKMYEAIYMLLTGDFLLRPLQ